MRALIVTFLLCSGCSLVYDFEDLSGIPCRINEGCPTGYSCATSDGVSGECVVPGSRNFEESCSRNIQCAEGLVCDNAFCTEGQASCERACRNACEPGNMLSCTSPNELCIPAREPSTQGGGFCQQGNCIAASDCDAREVCVRDPGRGRTPESAPKRAICWTLPRAAKGAAAPFGSATSAKQPATSRVRSPSTPSATTARAAASQEPSVWINRPPTILTEPCAPSCATHPAPEVNPAQRPTPPAHGSARSLNSGSASHHATRCNGDSAPATTQPRTAASPPTPKSGTAARTAWAAPAIQPVIPPPPRKASARSAHLATVTVTAQTGPCARRPLPAVRSAR